MIPGTGSDFSGCCRAAVWPCCLVGSVGAPGARGFCVFWGGYAGVAVVVGAADAGTTGVADCCSIEAVFAVGAMACATGRPVFFVSVLSHAASNRTAVPKIAMLQRFTQN